jgi:hypothetical protein
MPAKKRPLNYEEYIEIAEKLGEIRHRLHKAIISEGFTPGLEPPNLSVDHDSL